MSRSDEFREALAQMRAGTYVPPPPELTDADLTNEQRAWLPVTLAEAWGQWPIGWKVECHDGALAFQNGDDGWDWRSVATAARAFPNASKIELCGGELLKIYGYEGPLR